MRQTIRKKYAIAGGEKKKIVKAEIRHPSVTEFKSYLPYFLVSKHKKLDPLCYCGRLQYVSYIVNKIITINCIAEEKCIPDSIVFHKFPQLSVMEEMQLLTGITVR